MPRSCQRGSRPSGSGNHRYSACQRRVTCPAPSCARARQLREDAEAHPVRRGRVVANAHRRSAAAAAQGARRGGGAPRRVRHRRLYAVQHAAPTVRQRAPCVQRLIARYGPTRGQQDAHLASSSAIGSLGNDQVRRVDRRPLDAGRNYPALRRIFSQAFRRHRNAQSRGAPQSDAYARSMRSGDRHGNDGRDPRR